MNFVVNGVQSNLICTNASTNSVGILTATPEAAALQVIGDIRVGGNIVTTRSIYQFDVGVVDSGGTGYKKVTVTTSSLEESINGIFSAGDIIEIVGCNITEMNGLKVIGDDGPYSFTYNIGNLTVTTGLEVNPTVASAKKSEYQPGVYKSSKEQIIHSSSGGTKNITASFSVTGLNVDGSAAFTLSATGGDGQEKYIYLKSVQNSGDKATVDNINGSGFNRIQFTKVGDAVSLSYDGESWVCLGVNGAAISTI
jgi:hypothetical protein